MASNSFFKRLSGIFGWNKDVENNIKQDLVDEANTQDENKLPTQEDLITSSDHFEHVYYCFYNCLQYIDQEFEDFKNEKQFGKKKTFFINLIDLHRELCKTKSLDEEKVISIISDILDHIRYKESNKILLNFVFKIYNYMYFIKRIRFDEGLFASILNSEYDQYLTDSAVSFTESIHDDLFEYESDCDKAANNILHAYEQFYYEIKKNLPEPLITRISRARNKNNFDISSVEIFIFDLPVQKFFYYDDGEQNKLYNKKDYLQLPPPISDSESIQKSNKNSVSNKKKPSASERVQKSINSNNNSNSNKLPTNTSNNNNNNIVDDGDGFENFGNQDNSDESDVDSLYEDDTNKGKVFPKNKGEWDEAETNRLARGLVVFDGKWARIANTYLRGLRSDQQIRDKCKTLNREAFIKNHLTEKQYRNCQKLKEKINPHIRIYQTSDKKREQNREIKRRAREKQRQERLRSQEEERRKEEEEEEDEEEEEEEEKQVSDDEHSDDEHSDEDEEQMDESEEHSDDDIIEKHTKRADKDRKKKKSEKKSHKKRKNESDQDDEIQQHKKKKNNHSKSSSKKSKSKAKSSDSEQDEIIVSSD